MCCRIVSLAGNLALAFTLLATSVFVRAETIHEALLGYDFSFDIPQNYSMSKSDTNMHQFKSPDGTITISTSSSEGMLAQAMAPSTNDHIVKGYVNSSTGFVILKRPADGTPFGFFVNAQACDGRCLVSLNIFSAWNAQAEAERLFNRYKADFVSRKFESPSNNEKTESTRQSEGWFVIAGAWSDSQKVKDRVSLLRMSGISSRVINTDEYSNLTPGLKAVVLGPTSKDQAQTLLGNVQLVVPDAFIKEGRN